MCVVNDFQFLVNKGYYGYKFNGIEDTEDFLLLCRSFDLQRRDLLAGIVELLRTFVQIANLSNDALNAAFGIWRSRTF